MTTITLDSLLLGDAWGMHGANAGSMSAMMIGMVLFWGAVILGIVWLIRNGVERPSQPTSESALAILDRRFAEGAVSADDYQRRRDVLTSGAEAHRPQDPGPIRNEGS
jgi:putative membrane protein